MDSTGCCPVLSMLSSMDILDTVRRKASLSSLVTSCIISTLPVLLAILAKLYRHALETLRDLVRL
jgi:hypothetical protein